VPYEVYNHYMMPINGRTGICETRGSESELTFDHIVPKWLLQFSVRMGITHVEVVEKAKLKGKMWANVCQACNIAKGGTIFYNDPTVRLYVQELMNHIQNKLDHFKYPRSIKVICGCGRREPCSTVPGIMSEVVNIHNGGHKHWSGKCWCGLDTRKSHGK